MNKRQIKKQARNLLTGRPVKGICFYANAKTSKDEAFKVFEYYSANAKFRRALVKYLGDNSYLELPFFINMKV